MNYWSFTKIFSFTLILLIVNGLTMGSPQQSLNPSENPRILQAIQVDSAQADSSQSPLTLKLSSNILLKESIENRSFANLVVYHEIPSTYSNKQLYLIRGRVINSSDNPEENFVRFIITNTQTKQSFKRTQYLSAGFFEFNILLDYKTLPEGKYKIESEVGTTKGQWAKEVEIVSSDKSSKTIKVAPPKKPEGLKIDYIDYELVLSWKEDTASAVSKIEFAQAGKVRSYIVSNFASRFCVPLRDFAEFEADTVTVILWNAYSESSSFSGRISQYSMPVQIQFKASAHKFIIHQEEVFTLTKKLPFRVKKGEKVTISGTGLSSLQNMITIQTPLKTFQQEWFQSDKKDDINIPVNTQVEKTLLLTEQGVYSIQVNNNLGGAVLLWPVIVGQSYPLLPHYYDLIDEDNADPNPKPGQPEEIDQQRGFLLEIINRKRAEFNVSPLAIEDKLNKLAQAYSQEMIQKDHYEPIKIAGLGPQQRANQAGIQKRVQQLIGLDSNLTVLFDYIFILPSELETIVSEEWKTAGFGLQKDMSENFIMAVVFGGRDYAAVPVAKPQIVYYRTQLASLIREKYPTILEENRKLNTLVSEWQNCNTLFKSLNKLESYLAKYGFPGSAIKTLKITLQPNFTDTQLSRSPLIILPKLSASKIGIGMKQVDGYELEIIVAYN